MAVELILVEAAEGQDVAKGVTPDELVSAENELRIRAQQLVKEIDHKYWDLGRVLYDVFDGVPGGYRALMSGDGSRQERQELFKKWGYSNFGDYCEREVGLRKRTAENLRYAYYWFAISQEMQPEVIDRLISIGRSKVYVLSGFATRDDILLWIDKAKELTYEDLRKSVKQAKAVSAGENVELQDARINPISEEESSGGDAVKDRKKLSAPEEWHTLQTSLAEPQWEVWQDAFKRASGVSGSEKVGHNLTLICQDFLANNDFSDSTDKDRVAIISKIEKSLGLMFIAVDPSSGKPIHGSELLWRMISEYKKPESE